MRKRLIHSGMAGLVLVLCLILPAKAGLTHLQAARIEAAFLVRFSRYVEWPMETFRNENDAIVIGILGRDPFGSTINRAARGFRANGRNLEIIRLQKITDAGKCHILFIAPDQAVNLNRIRAALGHRPVLLVSDMDEFLNRGGMFRFLFINNKLRFDINLVHCHDNGLEISSKLLRIAHQVTK